MIHFKADTQIEVVPAACAMWEVCIQHSDEQGRRQVYFYNRRLHFIEARYLAAQLRRQGAIDLTYCEQIPLAA